MKAERLADQFHVGGRQGQCVLPKFKRGLLYAIGLNHSLPLILVIFVSVVLCRAVFVHMRDMVTFDLQISFIDAVRRCLYRAIQDALWSFIARDRLSHLVEIDCSHDATGIFLERRGRDNFLVADCLLTKTCSAG